MSAMHRKVAIGLALGALFAQGLVPASEAAVPFRGRAQGAATSFAPGPAGIALAVTAQGTATQLGLFSREEHVVLNPAAGSLTGDFAFTAANGDQLVGTLTGQFVSPSTATGTYTFRGGTGRFASSTGTADFVLSTPDGLNFSVIFEGSLNR